MSGPRIKAETRRFGDDGWETTYSISCCASFLGTIALNPHKAQDHLGDHLEREHGIVVDPSALHIEYGAPD